MKNNFLVSKEKEKEIRKDNPNATEELIQILINRGKVLVSADAGCGKTYSSIELIKQLLKEGSLPYVTTFTNKSAEDSIEKLKKDIGDNDIQISTIHSFLLKCWNINNTAKFISPSEDALLKKEILLSILENHKDYLLINTVLNGYVSCEETILSLYDSICSKVIDKPREYLQRVLSDNINLTFTTKNLSKEDLELIDEIECDIDRISNGKRVRNDFLITIIEILLELDTQYSAKLLSNNLINYNMVEHIDLEKIRFYLKQNHIDSFIIDEYQDVNERQEKILKYIESLDFIKNSFKFGDLKQAIYMFRGSSPDIFIKRLNGKYGDKILTLTKNYRSNNELLKNINNVFNTTTYSTIKNDFNYAKVRISHSNSKYYLHIDNNNNGIDKSEVLPFPRKKECIKYMNKFIDIYVSNVLKAKDNVGILVSKRSLLNSIDSILDKYNIPKNEKNILDSNNFKFINLIINLMLPTEDKLLLYSAEKIGLKADTICISEDELDSEITNNDYYSLVYKKINSILEINDENLREILDLIIEENHIHTLNNKKNKLKEKINNTIYYMDLLLDNQIKVSSSINPEKKQIEAITKHSSKGLEYDCVINVIKDKKSRSPFIIFNNLGMFSNFVSHNDVGFIKIENSIEYNVILNSLKEQEKKQDSNLEYVAMTRAKKHYLEVIL